mmetsp:Transcript_30416/g.90767  ORF Transcript_30416/g.90767 Transcript_30416/m.90767 type:complete len:348 (-) Transcript_30416:1239-2282(-)
MHPVPRPVVHSSRWIGHVHLDTALPPSDRRPPGAFDQRPGSAVPYVAGRIERRPTGRLRLGRRGLFGPPRGAEGAGYDTRHGRGDQQSSRLVQRRGGSSRCGFGGFESLSRGGGRRRVELLRSSRAGRSGSRRLHVLSFPPFLGGPFPPGRCRTVRSLFRSLLFGPDRRFRLHTPGPRFRRRRSHRDEIRPIPIGERGYRERVERGAIEGSLGDDRTGKLRRGRPHEEIARGPARDREGCEEGGGRDGDGRSVVALARSRLGMAGEVRHVRRYRPPGPQRDTSGGEGRIRRAPRGRGGDRPAPPPPSRQSYAAGYEGAASGSRVRGETPQGEGRRGTSAVVELLLRS